jgi:hypothetical protein
MKVRIQPLTARLRVAGMRWYTVACVLVARPKVSL